MDNGAREHVLDHAGVQLGRDTQSGRFGQLVPDPETAPIVQRAFAEYVKPGVSLRSVCQLLTLDGIPSPIGLAWQAASLRTIFTAPQVHGCVLLG